MAAPSQTENKKTIEAVILSAEARRFWEQVYLACISERATVTHAHFYADCADNAVERWRERFEPKAGE